MRILFSTAVLVFCLTVASCQLEKSNKKKKSDLENETDDIALKYVDQDGDGYCGREYLNHELCKEKGQVDCDDNDKEKWRNLTSYLDNDGDGFGFGSSIAICIGFEMPERHVLVGNDPDDTNPLITPIDNDGDGVAFQSDCDDSNKEKWRNIIGYFDTDGDGFGFGSSTTICIGFELPERYVLDGNDPDDTNPSITPKDNDGDGIAFQSDCDDSNKEKWRNFTGYFDNDGDGFGFGSPVIICSGSGLPEKYVLGGNDPNDGNILITPLDIDGDKVPNKFDCDIDDEFKWQYLSYSFRDKDLDTYTVQEKGSICSGSQLPVGFYNIANGNDPDDGNVLITPFDIDGDGIPNKGECVFHTMPRSCNYSMQFFDEEYSFWADDLREQTSFFYTEIVVMREYTSPFYSGCKGVLTTVGEEFNINSHNFDYFYCYDKNIQTSERPQYRKLGVYPSLAK